MELYLCTPYMHSWCGQAETLLFLRESRIESEIVWVPIAIHSCTKHGVKAVNKEDIWFDSQTLAYWFKLGQSLETSCRQKLTASAPSLIKVRRDLQTAGLKQRNTQKKGFIFVRWGRKRQREKCFIYRRGRLFRKNEHGTLVEWHWQGKTEALGENLVPVPLCAPHISHRLAWDWTLNELNDDNSREVSSCSPS